MIVLYPFRMPQQGARKTKRNSPTLSPYSNSTPSGNGSELLSDSFETRWFLENIEQSSRTKDPITLRITD